MMPNRTRIHRSTIVFQFLFMLIALTLFSAPRAVFADADQVISSPALQGAKVIPKGDTLTVIQRPLLNIPALVAPGDTLIIECTASPGTSGWAAELLYDQTQVSLSIISSSYDASTLWWTILAQVPAVPLYELYDLVVTANGGIVDTTWQAVRLIPQFEDDYYFIHITDPHLPTHLYYYESGADTDTSEMQDLRAVMDDINIINPEFVLLTGDFINEGELEDYLDKRYYTRTQKLLTELQVPIYLTSGNHDIGGWDSTPPSDGTARRDWWRFFGWNRLNSPPAGAPWYTQNYSFDYGPVHYVGMESYINYDNWRSGTYGDESFTSGQMDWLDDDLADASGSASQVLFYHSDFSNQINLNSLGVEMALSGHIHSDDGSIYSTPYELSTDNVCDDDRAYRLIRVSSGILSPTETISAGGSGNNLTVQYSPANDGTNSQVTASIDNNHDERFEHALLRFLMPTSSVSVSGGSLVQVDDSGPVAVCYVAVDILSNSYQTVTVTAGETPDPPTITVTYPNGGETLNNWVNISWTATDPDVGETALLSIDLDYSSNGGGSWNAIASGESNDGLYLWNISGLPEGSNFLVRATATDTSGLDDEDTSDAAFTIAHPEDPSIIVTYPNGGETLSGPATIAWTATDPDPGETALLDIELDYSSNGGGSWTSTATGEANDGSYLWDVSGLSDGSNYLVRATATDPTMRSDTDESDATFSIDNPDDPSITVTYPNGGETLSGPATIAWTATDPDPGETALLDIDLEYSANGGGSWNPIATGETNDGSYLWDVSGLADGSNYLVRATATDPTLRTDTDQSDAIFTIQNTGPPAAIADLTATLAVDFIHLSWSPVDVDTAGTPIVIDHYVIYRNDDPGFSPTTLDSVGNTGGISYDDPTPALGDPDTNHYYVVKAVDGQGRKSFDSNTVGEFDALMINDPVIK